MSRDDYHPIEILDAPRPQRGGARDGAGRKTNAEREEGDYAAYGKARARHEAAKADLAELEVKVKTGEYVARAAVRQASAQAMQAVAQALRSIPDNLERQLGITPEVAEAVGTSIDATLNDLADMFEMMVAEEPEA